MNNLEIRRRDLETAKFQRGVDPAPSDSLSRAVSAYVRLRDGWDAADAADRSSCLSGECSNLIWQGRAKELDALAERYGFATPEKLFHRIAMRTTHRWMHYSLGC